VHSKALHLNKKKKIYEIALPLCIMLLLAILRVSFSGMGAQQRHQASHDPVSESWRVNLPCKLGLESELLFEAAMKNTYR